MKNSEMTKTICQSLINDIDLLIDERRIVEIWTLEGFNARLELMLDLMKHPDRDYETSN